MIKQFEPKVALKWVTPNGDQMLADIARVSVKDNEGKPITKLIKYMADHGHWSPFQMANMCVEVHAPRDISRQILRHTSMSGVQELSQRYAAISDDMFVAREARMQHPTNRQMSVDVDTEQNETLAAWWDEVQQNHVAEVADLYRLAMSRGIAKECARVILPEGNTMSRLYLNGTVRTWIHYLRARTDKDAVQREHVVVAEAIKGCFASCFPLTYGAFFSEPEYELVHTAGVGVCKARTAEDVYRWATTVWGEAAEIVVSFQPGFNFCRVTITRDGETKWVDYNLFSTGN